MHIITSEYTFEWNRAKEVENKIKHGYSFEEAKEVFKDTQVIFLRDEKHSSKESRYYAIGRIQRGVVLTVRYAQTGNTIRIFGAAYWRKWRKFYEQNSRSV